MYHQFLTLLFYKRYCLCSLLSDLVGSSLHHPASATSDYLIERKIFKHVLLGNTTRGHELQGGESGRKCLERSKTAKVRAGEEFYDLNAVRNSSDYFGGGYATWQVKNTSLAANLCNLSGKAGAYDELCAAVDGAVALLAVDDGSRTDQHVGELLTAQANGISRTGSTEGDLCNGQSAVTQRLQGGLGLGQLLEYDHGNDLDLFDAI